MYSNSIQRYSKWYGVVWYGMHLFRKIRCGFDLGKLYQDEIHVPIIWNLAGVIIINMWCVGVYLCEPA